MAKFAVVLNKNAKNAAQIDAYLDAFDKEKIDYQCYQVESKDLENQIKQCLTEFPIILVGGGDGTIRTAAQWCANTNIILGVLPLGTMNHFAKELGLPLTIKEIITSIKNKDTMRIDLAEVNGKIFVNNSSIGFYPKLAKKRDYYSKYYPKFLSYIPSFLQTLRYHETFSITTKSNELNFSVHTSFFMISNNLYSYQFPATIGRDSFNQKNLGIYFLKRGKLSLMKVINHIFRRANHFEIKSSKTPIKIEIENRDHINISLDGDTISMETPLIYRCLPDSLQILK
ncbi:diacylglycerol/lipid kinase family protein [Legionella hackeliae]|uniref:DAGKc domain-containing protein n=1 Tax=Legionella hackeliae TaxID=449 RepID=A0A0A8UVE1_LEGHA|nr:diacylglycerol kinase family protein [Legionella hackeliae]KTD09616.1 Diacylglycerol kinase [Legionella hackeliae]CEK11067.1 conserved protein of unknown function [Legionella hackeliae]STX47814.1 Diacylglycerol kinase [Legionella hackeliae]